MVPLVWAGGDGDGSVPRNVSQKGEVFGLRKRRFCRLALPAGRDPFSGLEGSGNPGGRFVEFEMWSVGWASSRVLVPWT